MRPAPTTRTVVSLLLAVTLLLAAACEPAVPAPLTSGGWTTSASSTPTPVTAGTAVSVTVTVRAPSSQLALVDVEVHDPVGSRVHQEVWDATAFTGTTARTFVTRWTVPPGATPERLTVKVGIFSPAWATMRHWNDAAAHVTVTAPVTSSTTSTTSTVPPPSSLPARPSGWPSTLELGMADAPGGASALQASVPVGLRYQYLTGGVNTGNGWAGWNPDGDFARHYIEESRAAGTTPVFSYYQIYQSNPGATMGEVDGVAANLGNRTTMASYYADLRLFFQRAGAEGGTTVLHVEPDMWAFLEQRAGGNGASAVPVMVASSGVPELAGLPDDAAGLGQAIVRLRDRHAPNVRLAYHFSTWGSGNDIVHSDPTDAAVAVLGAGSARFYISLGARFDLAFTDLADRDAEFERAHRGDGGASWYDADDYRRSAVFVGAFVRAAGLRAVLWQLPYGNTKMQAVNNAWNHYQDNKVEWLLDDPTGVHLAAYVDAGVVGLLFGRGADGVTCACDANRDGTTNPAPINGNTRASLSADDDGGYFRERARDHLRSGLVALP